MKKIVTIFLFFGLVAMTGTVSYAGEPDKPIPKIEKIVSIDHAVEIFVLDQYTHDIVGIDLNNYIVAAGDNDEHVMKKIMDIDYPPFYWSLARYKAPDILLSTYRQPGISARYNSNVRPPNRHTTGLQTKRGHNLPRIIPLE